MYDNDDRPPSAFSTFVSELLGRIHEEQGKLAAADLAEVVARLDEDSCAHIDSYLPENPDIKDRFTPLHFAARLGQTELVELLLDRGSRAIDVPSKIHGFSPLFVAAVHGHGETTALLRSRLASTSVSARTAGGIATRCTVVMA